MSETYLVVHVDKRPNVSFEIEQGIIEDGGGKFIATSSSDEDQLIANVRDADVILVSSAQITRRVVESMPKCKLIIRYGVGLDTLDIPAATDHGIVVAHFPDFCQPEVANQTMLLLLACAKKLRLLDSAVRDGSWRPGPLAPMGPIGGETLGLVALGNIARAVVPRAKAFGLNVIAHDPYLGEGVFRAQGVEQITTLEELLRRSDYVSVHTPLNAETRHLIGAAELAAMKPTAYLINTSRGPVVDEEALIEALDGRQIAGAGLDVFEREPLSTESPLARMENVVLMPHSASYSDQSFESMRRRVGDTVVGLMEGNWPQFVANPGVQPRAALPARD
ncbi:MAG: hydroxyacid dehydrogenase [Dehalococcoidia bacterium]|nr:hydroxyacid dehydrogenase [Dehalococcoidia bacterium]|tara:strand:+ start:638 stop:1642 length:1005 start_codon:yes stop_codon:yes gene_type:complete